MKSPFAVRIAAAMVSGVPLLATVALAASAPRLAPVYPGATPDVAAVAPHALVYLTKAPLPKVQAWYVKRLSQRSIAACGSAMPNEGCGSFQQSCEPDIPPDGLTRCSNLLVLKWNAIPPGGGMIDAYNAGVRLEGWKQTHVARDAGADSDAVSTAHGNGRMQALATEGQQVTRGTDGESAMDMARLMAIPDKPFKAFKQEVVMGRHTQKELDAVYRRYRHLVTAVYPVVEGQYGPVVYDELVFSRCKEKYSNRSGYLAGPEAPDHWKDWLGCLHKLGKRAYRTRIVIDLP